MTKAPLRWFLIDSISQKKISPPPSAVLVYYLLERWQIYMYQTSFYDSFMFTLHMGSVRIFALLCYLLKQIYAWKIKIKPFLHTKLHFQWGLSFHLGSRLQIKTVLHRSLYFLKSSQSIVLFFFPHHASCDQPLNKDVVIPCFQKKDPIFIYIRTDEEDLIMSIQPTINFAVFF